MGNSKHSKDFRVEPFRDVILGYGEKRSEDIAEPKEEFMEVDLDKVTEGIMLAHKAEDKAFRKKGLKEGRVEFICPVCGGTAIVSRYKIDKWHYKRQGGCAGCQRYYA